MTVLRKIIISFFIMFNLLVILKERLPLSNKFMIGLYRPIDFYLSYFSNYQNWKMPTTDPTRLNLFITAEVEFIDGTKDFYHFPRSRELGLIDELSYGERYDHLMTNILYREDYDFLWKDTAKFVLRKLRTKNFHKLPMKVHLVKNWNLTPRLENKFISYGTERTYESFKFYTYEVL